MATEVDKLTLASHHSGDFSVRELNTELSDLRRQNIINEKVRDCDWNDTLHLGNPVHRHQVWRCLQFGIVTYDTMDK